MRVRKIALAGLVAVAACTAEAPLTPTAAPPQGRLDQIPPDTTTPGRTGATSGSGLFGSGH
jgi:hypothetical protein